MAMIKEKLTAPTQAALNYKMDSYNDYYPYFGYSTTFSPISEIGNEVGGISHYEVTVTRSSSCD